MVCFLLRFKLACGLGEPWIRDGGIPQGCPLSMIFVVALHLPWCNYLHALDGVEPQLFEDNLKCVTHGPEQLLRGARFAARNIQLVGQQPAPSQCLSLSSSRATRGEMRNWIISEECEKWSVKLDATWVVISILPNASVLPDLRVEWLLY